MKKIIMFSFVMAILLLSVSCQYIEQKYTSKNDSTNAQNKELGQTKELATKILNLTEDGQETSNQILPVLCMKYWVNVGMESDYLVEKITSNSVTYRYFDYQHETEPYDPVTVPFEKTLEMEEGYRVLLVKVYLKYETNEEELKLSTEFINQLETNPEFRERLGIRLGKPFDRQKLKGDLLTPDVI